MGPRKKMHTPISLGVKAMSPLIRYRGDDNVRISVLFHDGNTCMMGVAFGEAAQNLELKLKVGSTYRFRYYTIKVNDKKYSNTKFTIYLRENTIIKPIKNGYDEIPKEKGMKISEMNGRLMNLLVSTSKVRISKVGELFRPKEKYLREVYVRDKTGEIKFLLWSYDEDSFPYKVGDYVKMKYVILMADGEDYFLHKSDMTKIVRCKHGKVKVK